METAPEKAKEINSALRCRLTQAEASELVDPEAANRHLLLQDIAQNAVLGVDPVMRKGLFRRSR